MNWLLYQISVENKEYKKCKWKLWDISNKRRWNGGQAANPSVNDNSMRTCDYSCSNVFGLVIIKSIVGLGHGKERNIFFSFFKMALIFSLSLFFVRRVS